MSRGYIWTKPTMYLGTSFSSVTGNYAGTGTSATNASITLNTIGLAISVADFNSSAALNTSQSSLFQHTSATSGITNSAMNTSERGNYFYTSNNTFANQTHSHGNITINGTNISASYTSASNGLTINLSSPDVGGAQTGISGVGASNTTYSSGTVIWSGQNNLTIGTSVDGASQYVRLSVGNYLTTAAASDHTHTQYVNTSISSQWLTTAALSNHTHSQYQSTGAYLTTAMQSICTSVFQYTSGTSAITSNAFPSADTTKFAGTGTSATNATITLNSNGLAISVNSGGTGGGVAVKASGTYSQNTGTIEFANSNGLTFGLSDNGTLTASYDKGSVYFNNSNGITFGSSSDGISTSITASYNSTQFLTTAMASNASSLFAGINLTTGTTSDTDIKITLNTAGLNISYPKYLTTAPGTGSTITGASLTFNSAGINLSITHPQGSMYFINSNGHSFSSSSDGISTSVWIYTA